MNDYYWITVHTGSRNLGKQICDYWQKIATTWIKDRYEFNIDIKGLEFIENEDAHNYLADMIFAQAYAEVNREYIIKHILQSIGLNGYSEYI